MAKGNFVNISDIAQSLTPLPNPLIERDSSLATIESIFSSDVEAVFLQGNEGIGKTAVARLFIERNNKNTISIFIRPFGSYSLNLQTIIIDLLLSNSLDTRW